MKFQYRVLNISEVQKRNEGKSHKDYVTIIDVLNELGGEGWEVCFKLTEQSFLLKRAVQSE